MTSLQITSDSIPDLTGKVALITGGSSGIGHATALILAQHHATVHVLDLSPPTSPFPSPNINFHTCDVSSWTVLLALFTAIGPIHLAFANAGISEVTNSFAEVYDAQTGELLEPDYGVVDVNLKGVVNFVKLAWWSMRKHGVAGPEGVGGSIVITASATAYAPEQSLPVYAASKSALIGLLRALRSVIIRDNITLNAVAPAATITNLLPAELAAPIIAAGLPVSSAHFVGMALVYSATAREERRVQAYGKEKEEENVRGGRWNGRCILTLKDMYTEVEEMVAETRGEWLGEVNLRFTRMQQAATDFRT